MNERIKELAEQAAREMNETGTYSETKFQQKFAELIVGQMLEITDAHTEVFQTDRDKALIEHIKQSVKQHFGVKG
jgi:3-dehydroquinate dehydratase